MTKGSTMAIIKRKKKEVPKRKRDTTRHDNLVSVASKWLKNSCGCSVVMEEPVCWNSTGETPDAIGFRSFGSILVECKTSRSDFMREKKKRFRQSDMSEKCLGNFRFYLVDEMFVSEDDIPEGWGLYLLEGKKVVHKFGTKWSNAKRPPFESYFEGERALLFSALRKSK